MRALLVLFMVHQLKYADAKTNLIYGTYTALVYLMPLFGGIAADKVLGYRRAIIFRRRINGYRAFDISRSGRVVFLQEWLFNFSNGFFKPNISTMVGRLYRDDDDAPRYVFSISLYMGVNLFRIGSLFCGGIGQNGYKNFNFYYGRKQLALRIWGYKVLWF